MESKTHSLISAEIDELFGSGTVIVFTCAPRGNYPILSVSQNCRAILGFENSYFLNSDDAWSQRIHPDDRQWVDEQFDRVIQQGDAAVNEYRFQRKDGRYIWLRDELKLIKRPQSEEPVIFGSSLEMTDRKEAELVLKESKKQYESVVSHVKDIIFKVDAKGRLTFLNKTWVDRTGFSKEETLTNFYWDYLHAEDRESCRGLHQSLANGDVTSVTRILRCQRKYKGPFWAELCLKMLPKKANDETAIIGTLVDVSADIARHEEVEAINKQLEERVNQRSRQLQEEIERRKEADKKLQQQLSYEQALSKCSSLLLKDDSPQALARSLRVLLEASGSDRVYLYRNIEKSDGIYLAPVEEVCREGVETAMPAPGNYTCYSEVPWWQKNLSDQKVINAPVDEIPHPERDILKSQSVQSVLVLPIFINRKWVGYIGFADTQKKRSWKQSEVGLLKTASQIIASYGKRKMMEESLVDQRNYTETILNSLPSIYLLMDDHLQLKQWNKNAERYTGFNAGELADKTAFDLIVQEDHEELKSATDPRSSRNNGVELTLQTKAGRRIPYTWQGYNIKLEGEEYFLSVGLDISQQKQSEKELRDEKRFNEALIESLPGIFYMINAEGKYERWNQNFVNELGYSPAELRRMGPRDLFEEEVEYERVNREIKRVYQNTASSVEAQVTTGDGKKIPYHFTGTIFSKSEQVYLLGVGYDITEQKKYEEEIQDSLEEKSVLLQEIHHRVKNNLAVVSGLLQLQMYESGDPVIREALQESESRIQTMALIHEKLYQSQNLSRISCQSYLEDLVGTIKSTNNAAKEISLEYGIQDVKLNINKAVPFALLLNEVVTNSFKHAFEGRTAGKITIQLREQDGLIYTRISDNGVGLPEDFSIESQDTLGMTLIKNFAKQLSAEWELSEDQGTYLSLSFPAKDIKGSAASSLI